MNLKSQPKSQHYVPQVYLRNFAMPGNKKKSHQQQIWCFDKLRGKSYQTNVSNIAQENRFHDLSVPGECGEIISIEDVLSKWETDYGKAISSVIADVSWANFMRNKAMLAHFIACQMARTTDARNLMYVLPNALHEYLVEQGYTHLQEKYQRVTRDEAKVAHLAYILNATPEMANMLVARRWMLLYNPTRVPFWTSDSPIVTRNITDHPAAHRLGIRTVAEGAEQYVPISPKLLIGIVDPVRAIPEGIHIADERQVREVNAFQVDHAHRLIFSCDDDFSAARALLKLRPRSATPRSARVCIKDEIVSTVVPDGRGGLVTGPRREVLRFTTRDDE
jgi:hypothetical protein